MAIEEAHQRRSRVVIETPAARREEVVTRTAYAPVERRGVSTSVVAIVAIAAVVATAIVAWALTRPSGTETDVNVRTAAAQPTPMTQVVTVPVPQQQPVVMPPTTTTTTTQPVIVPVPSTTTTTTSPSATSGSQDGTIQSDIEKRFADDPKIASLGITVSVLEGKVTLIGTVDSQEMKNRIGRMANIRGVKSVENQIIVTGSDTSSAQE